MCSIPRLHHTEPSRMKRKRNGHKSIQRYHGQRKHTQLTRERRQESRQFTEMTRFPCLVMRNVNSSVVGVDAGDDHEVDAHEHVTEGQLADEERVNLLGRHRHQYSSIPKYTF